mmetsp:Transcript_16841/g.36443  ORF Transcript_16841/g.36443 Transcript_16841/m.36443 type:complete len:220 (-) Transcript_16841:638-1297(-)
MLCAVLAGFIQSLRHGPQHLHHFLQHVIVCGAGKEDLGGKQLHDGAAQRPHIQGATPLATQDDLWSTVKPRPQVRGHERLRSFICRAQITDLHHRWITEISQHVVRLEVTMHNLQGLEQPQTHEQLLGHAAEQGNAQSSALLCLRFQHLAQIPLHALESETEMVAVIEFLQELHEIFVRTIFRIERRMANLADHLSFPLRGLPHHPVCSDDLHGHCRSS